MLSDERVKAHVAGWPPDGQETTGHARHPAAGDGGLTAQDKPRAEHVDHGDVELVSEVPPSGGKYFWLDVISIYTPIGATEGYANRGKSVISAAKIFVLVVELAG